MAAPTLTATYTPASNWTVGGVVTKTTSVTVAAGDSLVLVAACEAGAVSFTASGGTGITWGTPTAVNPASHASCAMWVVGSVGSGQTFTLQVDKSGGGGSTDTWGFMLLRWAGGGVVGTPASGNGTASTPSLAVTTAAANSALACINTDWNATAGARTYRQVNGANPTEQAYFGVAGSTYIGEVFTYADAGAAGAKTVGLTAPTGETWATIAVEVQGTGGGGSSLTASPADSAGITDNVTASLSGSGAASPVDQVGVIDSLSVAQARTVVIGDQVGVADTGAPQALAIGIDLDDPVGLTDGAVRTVTAARGIDDPVGLGDSAAASSAGAGSAAAADPLGVTDLTSVSMAADRPTADGLPITDSAAAAIGYVRATADAVGLSDGVSASLVASGAASLADTVGIGDTATAVLVRNTTVAIADPVGATDEADRVAAVAVMVADALGIIDLASLLVGVPPDVSVRSIRERTSSITCRERGTSMTIRERG